MVIENWMKIQLARDSKFCNIANYDVQMFLQEMTNHAQGLHFMLVTLHG